MDKNCGQLALHDRSENNDHVPYNHSTPQKSEPELMLHDLVERVEEARKCYQPYDEAFKFFKGIRMACHCLPFLSE